MNQLRVVHVIQGLGQGGAERLVMNLVRARSGERIRHSVVTLYNAPPARVVELRAAGVTLFQIGKARRPDPLALYRLTRVLRRVRPDIVHAHTFSGLIYGNVAAIASGISRTVYTDHASGDLGGLYGKLQWLPDYLERHGSAIITFSDSLKSQIVASRRLRPENIRVIPNGVPVPDLVDGDERARIREGLGILSDEIFVLSVGGLRPQKNYRLLLGAIARIQSHAPHLRLRTWIVGDGIERERLMKSIKMLSLAATSLAGERDDVTSLMSACDVYVNTSIWEAMPMSVLEAMAAGRPVIATRVGMLPELLSSAGILVDPEESSVAEAIIRLGTDTSLRSRLGALARELVIRRCSIEGTAESHEALYVELLTK